MKKVYVPDSIPQAHLVAGLLEGRRIHTRVENENLVGAYGEIPPMAGTFPTVYVVDDTRYEEAMEILSEKVEGFRRRGEYKNIVEKAVEGHFWVLVAGAVAIVIVVLVLSNASL